MKINKTQLKEFTVVYKVTQYCNRKVKAKDRQEAIKQVERLQQEDIKITRIETLGAAPFK